MRHALYAGSFDPPTNGHLHVIEIGAQLFDELTVVIAGNAGKKGKHMFTVEERVAMLSEMVGPLENVYIEVCDDDTYVASMAEKMGIRWLFRGMRSSDDAKAELALSDLNRKISKKLRTIIAPTEPQYVRVSSSNVKAFIGPDGWEDIVSEFVPPCVLEALKAKHHTAK